jgi:hypothetical protein
VTRFFCKHAGLPPPPPTVEGAFIPLDPKMLQVCPGEGQVLSLPGSVPVYQSLGALGHELSRSRAGQASLAGVALDNTLRALLHLPPTAKSPIPDYRKLAKGGRPDWIASNSNLNPGEALVRYAIATEPGIEAILYKPVAAAHASTLDLAEDSPVLSVHVPDLLAVEELASVDIMTWLQHNSSSRSSSLYLVECRGTGESFPESGGEYLGANAATAAAMALVAATGASVEDERTGRHPRWQSYGLDYMWHGHGLMFSESYLGRRVRPFPLFS